MKNFIVLCLGVTLLAGCAAKRANNGSQPPAPITTWEQVNYDNLQIAVHNRAISKALIAAYQSGLLDDSYFDLVKKKGIAITQAHQKLTPLLKDLATTKAKSDQVKAILQSIVSAAGDIATAAGVKNPQAAEAAISEAQIVQSLANSILVLLQGAGVITERRNHGPTDSSEAGSISYSSRRHYARGYPDDQKRWCART